MTEELEKEAEEYATENYEQCIYDDVIGWKTDYEARKQAYLAGAEPREKRIAELEQKIKSLGGNSSLHEGILWNDIHNQDKKIAELETQIEKMKADVRVNIKVADQSNNCLMYQKLNSMLNQWEIEENEEEKKA